MREDIWSSSLKILIGKTATQMLAPSIHTCTSLYTESVMLLTPQQKIGYETQLTAYMELRVYREAFLTPSDCLPSLVLVKIDMKTRKPFPLVSITTTQSLISLLLQITWHPQLFYSGRGGSSPQMWKLPFRMSCAGHTCLHVSNQFHK